MQVRGLQTINRRKTTNRRRRRFVPPERLEKKRAAEENSRTVRKHYEYIAGSKTLTISHAARQINFVRVRGMRKFAISHDCTHVCRLGVRFRFPTSAQVSQQRNGRPIVFSFLFQLLFKIFVKALAYDSSELELARFDFGKQSPDRKTKVCRRTLAASIQSSNGYQLHLKSNCEYRYMYVSYIAEKYWYQDD